MTRRSKSAEDQLLFPRGYHVDRELPPKRKGLPAGALGKGLPCAAPSVVFLVASLLLVAMPGACSGFLFLVVRHLSGVSVVPYLFRPILAFYYWPRLLARFMSVHMPIGHCHFHAKDIWQLCVFALSLTPTYRDRCFWCCLQRAQARWEGLLVGTRFGNMTPVVL